MRRFFAALFALSLLLTLAACGGNPENSARTGETVTLRVGATPTPHAEILRRIAPALAEQGIVLEVVEYGDYVVPNTALESRELDANYFQHIPHLDNFNTQNEAHLKRVTAVHYEPFGIYPGRISSLSDLPDGALIGLPSDSSNEARALQLLEAQGLIVLREGAGLTATPNDVIENPKSLRFHEIEAAMLPRITQDVDLAVINGNYALQAGFSSARDALALEDASSEAAQTFANILAVYEGDETRQEIKALAEALTSESVRIFLEETYSGNVIPSF